MRLGGFLILLAVAALTCLPAGAQTVMGDLNGNGKVDVADANIALRLAVGVQTATPAQLAVGDVTGDGRIGVDDVQRILSAALGIISPDDLVPDVLVTTVVGDTSIYADGAASVARFSDPEAAAIAPDGSVYVADTGNNRIRRVAPDGTTTTVAGSTAGFRDGPAAQALFNNPYGLAVDSQGVIYVADSSNRRIRKITPDGMVSTVAGAPDSVGGYFIPDFADGPANVAKFGFPAAVAVAPDGTLYVADYGANRVRKVAPDGTVSTIAGNGYVGFDDGKGADAKFAGPAGVAVSQSGTLYVADFGNHLIRAVAPDGTVTTFTGSPRLDQSGAPIGDYQDGPRGTARFNGPANLYLGPDGSLYVADANNNRIRKVASDGSVSTVAGDGEMGSQDGSADKARFNLPGGLAVAPNGTIFVADSYNNSIRRISTDGAVSTFAGVSVTGSNDGPGNQARLFYPEAIAFDASGNLIIADSQNYKIRKLSPDGTVSTIAGDGTPGYADGDAATAEFALPTGVALDALGNIYVADRLNNMIRKITPAGQVSTVAGSKNSGFMDGDALQAQFDMPRNLAVRSDGAVVIADTYNHCIRLLDGKGQVSTIAGAGQAGYLNGLALNALFAYPQALAFDAKGNLLISDADNHMIRVLSPDGTVSTLAGDPATVNGPEGAYLDGPWAEARFNLPSGMATDKSGNIYLADKLNNRIRKIGIDGRVTTVAGGDEATFADGPGRQARFWSPIALAFGPDGALYVSDSENHRIRKITRLR